MYVVVLMVPDIFQQKNKHILHYNNIPALDSFRENPTNRMCPVTESAPLSPIYLFIYLFFIY